MSLRAAGFEKSRVAAMQQILSKFTIKPIRFEGIQRIESPQYPIEALREILLNAMVHRRHMNFH